MPSAAAAARRWPSGRLAVAPAAVQASPRRRAARRGVPRPRTLDQGPGGGRVGRRRPRDGCGAAVGGQLGAGYPLPQPGGSWPAARRRRCARWRSALAGGPGPGPNAFHGGPGARIRLARLSTAASSPGRWPPSHRRRRRRPALGGGWSTAVARRSAASPTAADGRGCGRRRRLGPAGAAAPVPPGDGRRRSGPARGSARAGSRPVAVAAASARRRLPRPNAAAVPRSPTRRASRRARRRDPPLGHADAGPPLGISTSAVTPPPGLADRATRKPCRRASRPTTNRPSTSVGARSSRSRRVSRAFSSASRSRGMPMPWSTMVSRTPRPVATAGDRDPGVRRGEGGGVLHQLGQHQHEVADHRRRHRDVGRHLARRPGCSPRSRRAPAGPRRRAASARCARRRRPRRRARPGCWRCGAAGWRRGRAGTGAAAGSGRSPRCSSRSISAICRPTRFWVRRPTWPNICATLRRLATCRSTSRAAVPCTRSKARARSPISSRPRTSTGSSRTGSRRSDSSSATRTSSASATRATRSAERVRRVSGRATVRATATLSSTTAAGRAGQRADHVRGGERPPLLVGHLGDHVGDDLLLDELAERDQRVDGGEERGRSSTSRSRLAGSAANRCQEVGAGTRATARADQVVERRSARACLGAEPATVPAARPCRRRTRRRCPGSSSPTTIRMRRDRR